MSESFAIMIIWFGFGQTQSSMMEKFSNIEQCEIAKEAIIKSYENDWTKISPDDIRCIEIPYGS